MTATIAVNGTPLDDLTAQGIAGAEGLHRVPGKRGKNIRVPGRHGELHVPGKRYEPAALVLPLWARGVLPDGTLPADEPARLEVHRRLRALTRLFTVGELVTVRQTLTDGTAREISGEVTDAIDWSLLNSGRATLGKVAIGLDCPDPFWTDLADTTATATLVAGQTATLTDFASADAPMDDLRVAFGPGSNPELSQPSTGAFIAYDGTIATGRKLVVDAAAWSVTGTVDAGGTWQPGSAPSQHIARIRHGRHPRLFTLAPQDPAPAVRLTHTGGGSMTVSVVGRRRYLVP